MASPGNSERDPLEMLAAEFMDRLRQGQRPSTEEYAAQHPELAEEIRELFPTIAMTERLKARQEQTSGGRVTLGAAPLTRLGDFRIIREIGRGGMGVVFEAEQESLGRRVAVKVLPRQTLLGEKHLKRFQREARIAANLHHTNIVEIFGVGELDGFNYYVMQLIEGVGLDAVVPELAKAIQFASGSESAPAIVPPEKDRVNATVRQLLGAEGFENRRLFSTYWQNVARLGWQAADALSYAHSQGVLHRDIKPANLLLDTQGMVWLADFGLAKAAQSDDVSLSKDIVGTVRYMPPEQFQGSNDHRSDIYSVGLTLYELLALRPAYEETDQSRLIQHITQGPPPTAPSATSPGIPRDLETIILKAISHNAGERYQSAGEMADDLRSFLEDRPLRARRAGPAERLGRWCRRNKALAGLAGTSLLLLVLVAVVASVGDLRTKKALEGEALERAKAEANANLAIEALDRTFERLYPTRMVVRPQPAIEGLRGEIIDVPNAPFVSKEIAALLEEMLPFYDRLAQPTGNGDDLRLRTAEANRRVGAIRQRLGQPEEAVKAYHRAIALFLELRSRSPINSNLSLKVAQIQNELGRLFTSQRQTAEASQSHLAALALLQTDAARPSAPPAVCFELARTCFFLGLPERPLPTAAPRERPDPGPIPGEQRDNLAKAVTVLKSLLASSSANPEYQHLLALCYLEGATVEGGRTPETRKGDERAIEILEDLVKSYPAMPDYAYDLSEAYTRMHIPEPPISPEVENAVEQRFGKALALLERLVAEHPDVPDFLFSEARLHHKLGSFYRQMEHWADAEQSFRKAVAIQALLVSQFPDAPYYGLWMANFRIALADALIRLDRPGEARTELDGTIPALLAKLNQRPGMDSLHDMLALAYSRLEIAFRQTGDKEHADEAASKAEQERNAVRHSP
jgi:serine/threonine protein kinase